MPREESLILKPVPRVTRWKAGMLDRCSNPYPPQAEGTSCGSLLICSVLIWRKVYGHGVHTCPNHHLCSQSLPTWATFPSVLRLGQNRNNSVRQPLKMLEYWMWGPVLSFLPQGEARSWGLTLDGVVLWWGRDYGKRVPCIFLLGAIQPVLCTGRAWQNNYGQFLTDCRNGGGGIFMDDWKELGHWKAQRVQSEENETSLF